MANTAIAGCKAAARLLSVKAAQIWHLIHPVFLFLHFFFQQGNLHFALLKVGVSVAFGTKTVDRVDAGG